MDKIIDKLILEWSWRCEKGYPDINSGKDLEIFKSIVGDDVYSLLFENVTLEYLVEMEKKEFTYLSPDVQEIAKELGSVLNIPIENIKASTRRAIILITDMSRVDFFEKVKPEGYIKKNRNTAINSENNVIVIHKPLSAQVGGGHGKANESIIVNNIQTFLEQNERLNITFKGEKNGVQKTVVGITQVADTSRTSTLSYVKSDFELLTDGKQVLGVSIKEDTGGRWESSKKRFPELFKKFIEKALNNQIEDLHLEPVPNEKNKYRMKNPSNENYGKVYIVGIPDEAEVYKEIVFGPSTLSSPTIAVERSFNPSDFTFTPKVDQNSILEINCTYVFESYEDVVEAGKEPVLVFSHHIGTQYGIELRAFPKDKVPQEGKGRTLTVTYDEIVN